MSNIVSRFQKAAIALSVARALDADERTRVHPSNLQILAREYLRRGETIEALRKAQIAGSDDAATDQVNTGKNTGDFAADRALLEAPTAPDAPSVSPSPALNPASLP